MLNKKKEICYDKNGWKYISISGSPKKRGYTYGFYCANDFKEIQNMLNFLMMEAYGNDWKFFINKISLDFKDMIINEFNEYYEEMEGIVEGLKANGCDSNIDEIIAWNFYCSIPYWYSIISESHTSKEGGAKDHCSAFMAVGDWTEDGKIVCAHNSFCDFIDGQYSNVVLDIKPEKGHRMIMQTSPCWIWSGTDFFVTSKGIIGTETTIGGFIAYKEEIPISCRIRNAMQYGNTLDEYCEILLHDNSGDYANSWLFGDTNKNEIMRIELGLRFHKTERTKNGYFIGFNAPYDARIRNLECVNTGIDDIRRHQGARKVRLADLMDEHKGKLNIEIAQKIIADHYDVYLNKENPCSRTCCSHYELDAREYMSDQSRPKPFQPRGALDGNVVDSTMAKNMSFSLRWGTSCGIPFDANKFCSENRVWDYLLPYLHDRPQQPWTTFYTFRRITNTKSKSKTFKKQVNKNKKSRKNN